MTKSYIYITVVDGGQWSSSSAAMASMVRSSQAFMTDRSNSTVATGIVKAECVNSKSNVGDDDFGVNVDDEEDGQSISSHMYSNTT